MRLLYSVAYTCALPLILLRLWWRGHFNPAYRRRLREQLGFYLGAPITSRPLWIHAVSVGEVIATTPLIRALRARDTSLPILVTTTTPTGRETLDRLLGVSVAHAYFPVDLPWAVRRFMAHFAPRALLLVETEIWPNVVAGCHAEGVPVFLINGRLSARSAARYAWVSPLLKITLLKLTQAAMQTPEDATRLMNLGAPAAITSVAGSLKFDVYIPASLHEEAAALRRELGLNRQIFMAGSTRPGEEERILDVFVQLKRDFPALLLILAPRHPERFHAVAELCRSRDMRLCCRSDTRKCSASTEVFVLDSMGELLRFYAASDVAFVGGSLVPLGGHNLLEPAALGIPIVTGPHLFNFSDISSKLLTGGALKIGRDAAEVASIVRLWLGDSNARDSAGRCGREIVANNRGATSRVLAMLGAHGLCPA